MCFVEILEPSVEDVGIVFVWLDGFFVEFFLGGGGGDETVFCDVVAETVGCLGVLAR